MLVVTLLISMLFAMFLGGYLLLARHQSSMIVRAQAWNSALPLAEAGVEEALAKLNPGIKAAPSYPPPKIIIEPWGPKERTLSTGSYSVVHTGAEYPIIYATGYVRVPFLSANLSRTVKVATTNVSLFSAALVGIYGINFSGNGVKTDSFNSSLTNLSTGGYYDPNKVSTNGDIASVFGIINVANGDVHGSVYRGPTATNELGKNGTITGGISNDFNVEFESVVLPDGYATWLPAVQGSTTIGTNTYTYAFGDSCPNLAKFTNYTVQGSSLKSLYVGTNTSVTLLVTGSASPTNICIAGVGTNAGHLTLYMNGPTFQLSGNSYVASGNAMDFQYYGTTNNTKVSFTGNASFIGTLYAPQATFELKGGGSTYWDFTGSAIAKTATVTGNWSFHFDENLGLNGPKGGFVATSWREL